MKQNLKIDWCSHEAALYSVQKWHYSRTLPRGKLAKLGVWEDDQFIGAVIFSMGASARSHRQYGLTKFQCCELTRIALREHETPVSAVFNAPHFCDFVIEQPTPVVRNEQDVCRVNHYSNPVSFPAKNRVLSVSDK